MLVDPTAILDSQDGEEEKCIPLLFLFLFLSFLPKLDGFGSEVPCSSMQWLCFPCTTEY